MASKRNGLAREGKIRQQTHYALILCFLAAVSIWLLAAHPVFAAAGDQSISMAQAQDPNKGPSEFNHHIAGWALIGVGLFTLASLFFPELKVHRYIWPALFLFAGLFLALWSDGEIWPRGNLNWVWLLQHDAEARQLAAEPNLVKAARFFSSLSVLSSTSAFEVPCPNSGERGPFRFSPSSAQAC